MIDPKLDCSLRDLTLEMAARLLNATHGPGAIEDVADALQMETFCGRERRAVRQARREQGRRAGFSATPEPLPSQCGQARAHLT